MVCLRCCFVNKTKVSLLSTLLMSISERGVLSSPLSSRLTSSTQRFANWERWWPRSARQPFSRALKNSPPVCTPLLKAVLASTEAVLWGCICIVPKRPGRRRKRRGRKPPIRTRFQVVPGLHNYIALVDIITCDLDRFRGLVIMLNYFAYLLWICIFIQNIST